jgi:hypothetical protein
VTTRTLLALSLALALAGCRRDAELKREISRALDSLAVTHREFCTPDRETLAVCVNGARTLSEFGREP